MIFSGMIGSSVLFGVDKTTASLDKSINSLILYLDGLAPGKSLVDLKIDAEDHLIEI
jgi:hypothetical protein